MHTFGCGEVDDVAVRLKHVDLLNGLDWLHVHLLESCLELLVVCAGALVDLLRFPPWCALGSTIHMSAIPHVGAACFVHLSE